MNGGALILAAGYSRRFGRDKRCHVLPGGQTLLQASVALYAGAFSELLIVLRPEDTELARQVHAAAEGSAARVVFCTEAHLGMGRSLAFGAAAAATAGWSSLFVALADMPWVRPATLTRLREAMAEAPGGAVVQPVYRDQGGHPVGFDAGCFGALQSLTGDEGARQVARHATGGLLRLAVDDPGVLMDLDRPP